MRCCNACGQALRFSQRPRRYSPYPRLLPRPCHGWQFPCARGSSLFLQCRRYPDPAGMIDAIHCREFSWDDGHDLERAMPSGSIFHAQAQLIPRDDLWGIRSDGSGKTLKPEGIAGEEACPLYHGGVISGLVPPFASSSVHSRRSSLLHNRKGELFACEAVMLSFEMLIVFSEI